MRRRVAVARNLLKAWLLLLVPAIGMGFAGWELGGYRPALLFAGSVVLLAAALYWYADRIAMGMVGARELLPGEAPALHSTVERLSARAGVVRPRLYVLRDGYPRALSAGRGAQGGTGLAVSTGLLGVATPAELEGIVAHELAHLRNRDVLVQTLAVTIAAAVVEASRLGGLFQRALLFVIGPLAASFVHLLLSPKREYEADRFAAELCGSPHGLADALAAARAGDGARRVPGQPGDRAALHDEPVRRRGPRDGCSSRIRRSASACAGCGRSTRSGAKSSAQPRLQRPT